MSDLPNYDELVAVRLELARIRDHRDALQSGLTKEIRELIRKELSAQLDAVSCQLVERDDLKAENARLKAEVERLTKAIDLTIIDLDERHERQDLRAWEFAELLRKAKGVQS
jgi:hypothetical protein